MTTDEILAVVTAFKEGKQIETLRLRYSEVPLGASNWVLNCNPCWNFMDFEYRVKAQPREWWLNDHLIAYGSEISARIVGCTSNPVHVREVLP